MAELYLISIFPVFGPYGEIGECLWNQQGEYI